MKNGIIEIEISDTYPICNGHGVNECTKCYGSGKCECPDCGTEHDCGECDCQYESQFLITKHIDLFQGELFS